LPIRNTSTAFSRLTGRSALKYSVRQKVLIEKSTKKTFNLKSTALPWTPRKNFLLEVVSFRYTRIICSYLFLSQQQKLVG
jgi:hypothetical protein